MTSKPLTNSSIVLYLLLTNTVWVATAFLVEHTGASEITRLSAKKMTGQQLIQDDAILVNKAVNTCSTKRIIGIRHGISIANEHMSQPGNEWGDPTFSDDLSLRDAPLSEAGKRQAMELERRLKSLLLNNESVLHSTLADALQKVELIVVSPLTRCLQTFTYGVLPAFREFTKTTTAECPPIIALPLATERIYTASDMGRPLSELEEEYPEIDWREAYRVHKEWYNVLHLQRHTEVAAASEDNEEEVMIHTEDWWYTYDLKDGEYEEWRPHGQGQWYAVPGEPEHIFETRMGHLERWLKGRPEKRILLVAHWGILRHFTGEETSNCGMCLIDL